MVSTFNCRFPLETPTSLGLSSFIPSTLYQVRLIAHLPVGSPITAITVEAVGGTTGARASWPWWS